MFFSVITVETGSNTKDSIFDQTGRYYKITKDVLSSGGPDDDLRPHRRNPNFNARVSIFSQLSGQNLVQLGEEHSVSYELYQNLKIKKKKLENVAEPRLVGQKGREKQNTFLFLLI